MNTETVIESPYPSQMGKSPYNSYQDAAVVIEFNNQSIIIPKDVSLTVSVLKDGKPVRGAIITSHMLADSIKKGIDTLYDDKMRQVDDILSTCSYRDTEMMLTLAQQKLSYLDAREHRP